MKLFFAGLCFAALLLITGCHSNTKGTDGQSASALQDTTSSSLNPHHATGFKVTEGKGYHLLDIQDPQHEEGTSYHFALVPRGTKPEGIPADYTVIETPVRSVICMTALQLSNFITLEALDRVIGITSSRFLFNKEMKQRLKEGTTKKIGMEGNFDAEVIIQANPDLILISPFKRGGYDSLKELGIPLLPHLGYKEMTPLGQAEWIKCMGLLVGLESVAIARFETIEKRYNELLQLTSGVKKRPVVFSGELRGGNWYAVGGRSFLAQLFRDAGADYFLKDDTRSGGVTLDFETVYSQADKADFWRILNSYPGEFSYNALKAEDSRYADFRAFREKGVVYCNLRERAFYESSPTQPEVVLADLIRAFHPDLLPDHTPVYYELIK